MSCTFPSIDTLFIRFFILALGLILLLPAVNKLYTYGAYRYHGSVVYGMVDHPSSGRDLGGRPLIRYEDKSGNRHEFKSRAKTHWFHRPAKGERIKIFTHWNKPEQAIVDSLFYYVLLPLIFLVAGCYCCLYAVFERKILLPGNRSQQTECTR